MSLKRSQSGSRSSSGAGGDSGGNIDRQEFELGQEVDDDDWERVVAEGVEAMVPARGPVNDIVYQLVGGLRSGLSYAGATSIQELWANAEFVRITSAGKAESGAHDVQTR